jgi:Acyltransferase family
MLQGLAAGQLSWNYPAWSISVEFIAYLVLPFALPVIGRAPQAARLVLGAVLFAVLALLAAFTQGVLDQWNGPITLVRCMPEFLLGTLLYFAFRDHGQRFWLSSDLSVIAILGATLSCLHVGAPDLLIVSLFAVLVLVAVSDTGAFARLANIGPLIWLGEISYSLSDPRLHPVRCQQGLGRAWHSTRRRALERRIPCPDDADAGAVHLLRQRDLFGHRDRLAAASAGAARRRPENAEPSRAWPAAGLAFGLCSRARRL